MSQLPEFEFTDSVFCVALSASVRWLHFALESVIGAASLVTGTWPAELGSGVKSESLVLAARADRPVMSVSASASGTRFDIMCSPGEGCDRRRRAKRQRL